MAPGSPTSVPAPPLSRRLAREHRTLAAMVDIHCRGKHGSDVRCAACDELVAFAERRLRTCPHGDAKPTCANCPIHCYAPERRAQVRDVMRHAGPRMMTRHPLLALRHWLDGFRKAPVPRRRPRPISG